MDKNIKRAIISLVCLAVAGGLLFGGKYIFDLLSYRRIVSSIIISTPDISQIKDGTFNGIFNAEFISADVDVIVENHRIIEITLNSHYHERGHAAEAVIDDVIINQTLGVDTVSGATNSSLVILKAIQIALENKVN